MDRRIGYAGSRPSLPRRISIIVSTSELKMRDGLVTSDALRELHGSAGHPSYAADTAYQLRFRDESCSEKEAYLVDPKRHFAELYARLWNARWRKAGLSNDLSYICGPYAIQPASRLLRMLDEAMKDVHFTEAAVGREVEGARTRRSLNHVFRWRWLCGRPCGGCLWSSAAEAVRMTRPLQAFASEM
jgi:hypothetical protein